MDDKLPDIRQNVRMNDLWARSRRLWWMLLVCYLGIMAAVVWLVLV